MMLPSRPPKAGSADLKSVLGGLTWAWRLLLPGLDDVWLHPESTFVDAA